MPRARRTPAASLLALLLLGFAAPPLRAQDAPKRSRDLSSEFELDENLAITLWAESPDLYNPTAMDVDARGRLWVTEAVDYRRWEGRNPGFAREGGDRVVILADTARRGACTQAKVFVQDPDLVSPLGICVLGKRVLVSCSPHVIEYVDEDGDDLPDSKRIFLTGFGGHDHDHGVHSFVTGPDGRLYCAVGNAGPHLVTDADGFTLRSGSLYVGGGEFAADNRPGLVSDDGRVWTGGLILRFDPDGGGMKILAHDFRNPYEVALDSFGDCFTRDNDDDGNEGCRTSWILDGASYGFFSADGSRTWQADRRPNQPIPRAHWHADDPGVAPPGTIDGSGGPTGTFVYEGELLGPWIGGKLLGADAGRGLVFVHERKPQGAGIELEPGVFLAARKGSVGEREGWFRPSDVTAGTDGALYVADWSDPVVGGHAMRDTKCYGRILRIVPKGRAPWSPRFRLDELDGQTRAFFSPAPSVRWQGFEALLERGAIALPYLLDHYAKMRDPRERARMLYLLAQLGGEGKKAVLDALDDGDPDLRIVAFRALLAAGDEPLELASELAQDPSPAVRRAAALALRDGPFERCTDALVMLARGYDGEDRSYLEAFGIAADGKEAELYARLAAELGDKPLAWDARFAGITWRLHPLAAVPALFARAMDERLSPEERAQAVDSLAFVKEREGGEAMLNLALAGPDDVRSTASWWIAQRDATGWADYRLLERLGVHGLADTEERYASGVLTNGQVSIEVDISDAVALWLVVDDAGDGNGCDWADWIEPRLVGPAGELRLTDLPWTSATAQWGEARVGANAAGGKLVANGAPVEYGIGTHARSEIAYQLPEDYERFVCRAGPDEGGTSQAGGRTSIRFSVHVEKRRDAAPLRLAARELLDPELDAKERVARAERLAAEPEGGMLLVQLASMELLDDELKRAVAEPLFRNPDVTVRTLASERFQRPLDMGTPLPSVSKIAAMPGDRHRGAQLFFGPKALCSSCHTVLGRGADVGPDLSSIRAKYGREALLDAILNPNAGIALGYESWVMRTTDGLLYSGFLLADGPRVVLKDTRGERVVLDADEIEERKQLTISAMPDNVGLGLEPQELADLASFLLHDPDAEPELGECVELFDGKSLAGWTPYLGDSGADPGSVWSVSDGVLHCTGRPMGYLRSNERFESFVLELEWRFPPGAEPGNSGVLLRTGPEDAIWPKSIECQLLHTNAGDVWNIGEFPMQVDASRTRGRRTEKLAPSSENALGEWNRYRITLDCGELRVEVNGVLQNRARWCEELAGSICLQSEGAPIEFRGIRLWPIRP